MIVWLHEVVFKLRKPLTKVQHREKAALKRKLERLGENVDPQAIESPVIEYTPEDLDWAPSKGISKEELEQVLYEDQFNPEVDSVEVPPVLDEEVDGDLLKWDSINTAYISAVAAIYKRQVSTGKNTHPNFRGVGFNNTMKQQQRKANQLAREQFEDRGANGVNSTYTEEDFLRVNAQLLNQSVDRPMVRKSIVLGLPIALRLLLPFHLPKLAAE